MDKEQAARINQLALCIARQLDEIMIIAEASGTGAELAEYKRKVGKIMGDLFIEVMSPLYREHPELTPPQLRRQS